jgi:hypothetical protein
MESGDRIVGLDDLPMEMIMEILSKTPREAWKFRKVSSKWRKAALLLCLQTCDDWFAPRLKIDAIVPPGYPRIFKLYFPKEIGFYFHFYFQTYKYYKNPKEATMWYNGVRVSYKEGVAFDCDIMFMPRFSS